MYVWYYIAHSLVFFQLQCSITSSIESKMTRSALSISSHGQQLECEKIKPPRHTDGERTPSDLPGKASQKAMDRINSGLHPSQKSLRSQTAWDLAVQPECLGSNRRLTASLGKVPLASPSLIFFIYKMSIKASCPPGRQNGKQFLLLCLSWYETPFPAWPGQGMFVASLPKNSILYVGIAP